MKFSNILLVLDSRYRDHAQVFRRAAAFARAEGASLTVSEAVEWVDSEVPRYMSKNTVGILTDAMRANKIASLEELVASCGNSDPVIAIELLIGEPHIEVARAVRENRYDLVIKPSAGRATNRFFPGIRKDRELIRSCPCPVWLVNDVEPGENNCILVALDMPTEGALNTPLNQHIVEISRSIALAESRPVHFVHVWQFRGEGHMRAHCHPATDLEVDRILVREAAKRKTWLQNTVALLRSDLRNAATDKFAPQLHVIEGPVKKVIPDLAEKLGAELIIVGTAARTGVSGILRRNTSERILPRTDCSLLVVAQPEQASKSAVGPQRMMHASRNKVLDVNVETR